MLGGMDAVVRAYIDAIDPETRPLFDRVHQLVLETHPEAEVVLSYKMPTYVVGRRRLHVGAWAHGISIYGWDADHDGGFVARHPELITSKGTIQLRRDVEAEDLDDDIRALAHATLD